VTLHRMLPLVALLLNVLLVGSALANDRKGHRNYVFAALATALAVWNLGVFGLRSTTDSFVAMTWEQILHLGIIPCAVLFYHYVLVFLGLPSRRPSLYVGYGLAFVLMEACPTSLFLAGVQETAWGYMPRPGPFYALFLLLFYSYLILGVVHLVIAYRRTTSAFRRNRTCLVLVGVGISLTGGFVDFLRFMLGWEWLYPIGIPTNAVFALALGVAIVRYRLLDVRILAKWLLLYALVAATLGPPLIAGLWLMERVTPAAGSTPHLGYVIALVVAITAALPLLRKLERVFERLMFARQHGVRDVLGALSKDLASVLDIDRLGRTLTDGLVTRIPAFHASLHLCSSARDSFVPFSRAVSPAWEGSSAEVSVDGVLAMWLRLTGKPLSVEELAMHGGAEARMRAAVSALEHARAALLLPVFLDGELAAILVLGEKVSGESYHSGEIELLQMLMGQTSIALKNSRLYADLRNQMEELTRTQQQLIQSAKLAAIGELAASVAHEINNPLMIILGNSDLMMRDMPAGSPVAKRVATIREEATRAGKITRDLLNFARRREPKREPVAVDQLVLRALELLNARISKSSVRASTDFDPAVAPILGDADQLTQVFLNLIGNAVDAMPQGGPLLIRTEHAAESDTVSVRIIDRGVGMTPEQRERIFEPFFTTKGEGRGTGLGLSVSLGIVRNHGGSLDVESEPGEGTTMVVRLPVHSVSGPARERVLS
jgi:signal transduction histidine kinase